MMDEGDMRSSAAALREKEAADALEARFQAQQKVIGAIGYVIGETDPELGTRIIAALRRFEEMARQENRHVVEIETLGQMAEWFELLRWAEKAAARTSDGDPA
jgi:hypothetical protein